MAKPKLGKASYAEFAEMLEDGEIPDGARVAHLLGGAKILGEYDDYEY